MRGVSKFVVAFFILSVNTVWAANLPDFKTLVKQAAPAVVNISTIQKANNSHFNPFVGPKGLSLIHI